MVCVLSPGELEKRESDFTRLQRARLSADDFEPLTIIGRGAFGEVSRGGGGSAAAGLVGVQVGVGVERATLSH